MAKLKEPATLIKREKKEVVKRKPGGGRKRLESAEPVEYTLYDERMLLVMEYMIKNQGYTIGDWLKSVDYPHFNNYTVLRKGVQHFTIKHLIKCCEVFNVDGRYLLSRSHTKMFNTEAVKSAYTELIEVVQRVGLELKNK